MTRWIRGIALAGLVSALGCGAVIQVRDPQCIDTRDSCVQLCEQLPPAPDLAPEFEYFAADCLTDCNREARACEERARAAQQKAARGGVE